MCCINVVSILNMFRILRTSQFVLDTMVALYMTSKIDIVVVLLITRPFSCKRYKSLMIIIPGLDDLLFVGTDPELIIPS